ICPKRATTLQDKGDTLKWKASFQNKGGWSNLDIHGVPLLGSSLGALMSFDVAHTDHRRAALVSINLSRSFGAMLPTDATIGALHTRMKDSLERFIEGLARPKICKR